MKQQLQCWTRGDEKPKPDTSRPWPVMIGHGAGTRRRGWPSSTDRQGMFTCPRGNASGRGGKYAVDILQGFSGIPQVPSRGLQVNPCRAADGYAGYNRLLDRQKNGNIQLAYCWAHARRKLYDVAKAGTAPIAQEGLKQIAALYRIEAEIKGQPANLRLAARTERTKPKLVDFEKWLTFSRAKVSAKSPTGQALKFLLGDCYAFACQAVHRKILAGSKPVPH